MNYKKHIFYPLTLLLLLLASACSQEEKLGNDSMGKGLTISMTIAPATGGSDTRATTTPLPGESLFDNAYLLIYKQGARDSDRPILVRSTTTANFNISDTELSLKESAYDICIIAGLPAGTAAPDLNTSKYQLMRLAAGKPESTPNDPKLIFTGKAELLYQYGAGDMQVNVPLQRIVARVDIQLANMDANRVAKVYLSDIAATASYWGSISNANGYYSIEATQDATDKGLYRAYINENYTTPSSRKASVYIVITDADGSSNEVAYHLIINNGIIERNKIYTFDIDVDTPDPTIIGFFGGWDETEQEYTKQLQVDTETYITDPLLAWEPSATLTNAVNRHSGTANVDILKAINTDLANYPAALHCEKKGNGWYLPSQAQLMAMWVISEGLPTKYKLASTTEPYWSSTEAGSSVSWTVSFADGRTFYLSKASVVYRVRCVRDVTP